MPATENYPMVELGRAPFATAARFDAQGGSCSLYNVTQADFLFRDESWQAHTVRLISSSWRGIGAVFALVHDAPQCLHVTLSPFQNLHNTLPGDSGRRMT